MSSGCTCQQHRSFSARPPSKLKFWSSETKHFCETSFKNEALKLKNEAFVRDCLPKSSFEDQKRSISARLPSKSQALKVKSEAFLRDFQPILRARPFLGADFPSQRSHKTMEKHSISRNSYPPKPHVTHLCCITSALSHLLVDISSAATLSIVGS